MSTPDHVIRVRRLYKLILRLHRSLPPDLRIMGNNYAREEFKRHKECKPEETRIFMNEWTDYAINLGKQMKPANQAKQKTVGMPLDPKLLDNMSDEQIVQLYELHKAAAAKQTSEALPAEVETQFNTREDRVDIQFDAEGKTTIKFKKGTNEYSYEPDVMETQFNGDTDPKGKQK